MSTATIRREKRALRQALSPGLQRQHSQSLRSLLIREKSYLNARHVGCYLANDGEIDPHGIIEHAWFLGKTVYLPILSPLKNQLYFAPYAAGNKLKLNRFKIPEPICTPSQWKTARQLDLLLLPLVAFDATGNRLGMGGGFYDRTLSYLHHMQLWRKPRLIGLAHECQRVEKLSAENWDVPVNQIISETQCYVTKT